MKLSASEDSINWNFNCFRCLYTKLFAAYREGIIDAIEDSDDSLMWLLTIEVIGKIRRPIKIGKFRRQSRESTSLENSHCTHRFSAPCETSPPKFDSTSEHFTSSLQWRLKNFQLNRTNIGIFSFLLLSSISYTLCLRPIMTVGKWLKETVLSIPDSKFKFSSYRSQT